MTGAVVGNVMLAARMPSNDKPAPTLNRAETRGMAAAISEPNMKSNSSSAQPRPIASERVSLFVWPMLPAPPP
jgi:hypothetical protein